MALIDCSWESASSICQSRTLIFQTGSNEKIVNVRIRGANNLSRYFATSNVFVREQSDRPAPGDIVLWVSYFCFVVAIVCFVFGTIVTIEYYLAANRWDADTGRLPFLVKFDMSAAIAGSMYYTSPAAFYKSFIQRGATNAVGNINYSQPSSAQV